MDVVNVIVFNAAVHHQVHEVHRQLVLDELVVEQKVQSVLAHINNIPLKVVMPMEELQTDRLARMEQLQVDCTELQVRHMLEAVVRSAAPLPAMDNDDQLVIEDKLFVVPSSLQDHHAKYAAVFQLRNLIYSNECIFNAQQLNV